MRRATLGPLVLALVFLPPPLAAAGPTRSTEVAVPGEDPRVAEMHRQFDGVREIHRALVFGDLRAARRAARPLARIAVPAGLLASGQAALERIRSAARGLSAARSHADARRRLTELAVACAGCHEPAVDASGFLWAPEPIDDGSASARMARHRWGSESAWMGLVAPSDQRWREGMDALALAPLPAEAMSDDRRRYPAIERWSRQLAGRAARARRLEDPAARGRAMAGLIELCVACHAMAR